MAKDLAEETFTTSEGLIVPFDDALLSAQMVRRLQQGHYEEKELTALKRTLKPDDRVLELGGGIGVISGFAGAARGVKDLTVVEANPRLAGFIRSVHALNNIHSRVHHGAVTPRAGPPVAFHLRSNFIAASLCEDAAPVEETIKVPALAIGALIEQSRPTVLIADIEGAEVEVLRAADLTGLRLILVETHPPDIGAAGTRAIFDICHAAGLTYFHRGSHGKVVCFRRDW